MEWNGGLQIDGNGKTKEVAPFGGDFKISEEDPPLWIVKFKDKDWISEEQPKTWEKTSIFH